RSVRRWLSSYQHDPGMGDNFHGNGWLLSRRWRLLLKGSFCHWYLLWAVSLLTFHITILQQGLYVSMVPPFPPPPLASISSASVSSKTASSRVGSTRVNVWGTSSSTRTSTWSGRWTWYSCASTALGLLSNAWRKLASFMARAMTCS